MSRACRSLAILLAAVALGGAELQAVPPGTAFTYQGQLKQSGVPYGGTADLIFTLYDAATGGNAIAGPVALANISVAGGLFAVQIDFGSSAFGGSACWIDIQVRTPSGSGSYVTLSPRQSVTATPYALSLVPGASIDGGTSSTPLSLYVNSGSGEALFAFNTATNGTGIYGESDAGASAKGVWGFSSEGAGVFGQADSSSGYGGSFVNGARGRYVELAGPHGSVSTNGMVYREYTTNVRSAALPIAYGVINSNGTVASGTGNFTSTRTDVTSSNPDTYYTITVTGESLGAVTVLLTPIAGYPNPLIAAYAIVGGKIIVHIWNNTTFPGGVAGAFSFAVFTTAPASGG